MCVECLLCGSAPDAHPQREHPAIRPLAIQFSLIISATNMFLLKLSYACQPFTFVCAADIEHCGHPAVE